MKGIFNGLSSFSLAAIQAIQNFGNDNYITNEPGIIENSLQLIYEDMVLDNDGYPCGKPSSWGQFWRGAPGQLVTFLADYEAAHAPGCWAKLPDPDVWYDAPVPDGAWQWSKSNWWYEIDRQQSSSTSCGVSDYIPYPNNTCIEVSNGEIWWLDDEGRPDQPETWVWKVTDASSSRFVGGTSCYSNREPSCSSTDYDDLRATMPSDYAQYPGEDYVGPGRINLARLDNGNILVNPINGYRYHAWYGVGPQDARTIQASYGCAWFRLVLIDPDGPDDRDVYNQIVHVASDVRADNNAFSLCTQYWSVGGLSRYKKIPNNGDWIPVNFLCFRYDSAYADEPHQITLQRVLDVNPPVMTQPN